MERTKGAGRKRMALAMTGAMTLAAVAGCGRSEAAHGSASGLRLDLERGIRSAMRRQSIAGLSAVVVSGGRTVLAAGFGVADRSRRIPVTVDTVFPLASITKVFTATAVMQLVERGAVDLDAPVSRYLPLMAGPEGAESGPTVRQLLTHHAGLQGNIMEGFELKVPEPTAFRDVPRLLAGMPRTSAPGTVFAYCNAGFSVLGCLVERAGGAGYAETVTRRILEPLGMTRTRFLLAPADAEGAAVGYDGRTRVPVYPIRDVPAGALLSTAADMERFLRCFVLDRGRDGVLGRAAFDEMTRRQNGGVALDGDFSIGLGWWLIAPFSIDGTFVSHAGDIPPFHAVLVTIPERRIGVFLAANSSRDPQALIPLAVELVRAAYADETGSPVVDSPPAPRVRLEATDLEALAGRYASPLGLLEVRTRGGKLLTRIQGAPVELVPRADGSFTVELSILGLASVPVRALEKVRFSRFEHDGVTDLRITALGIMAGVAEKLAGTEVPQAWRARIGRYTIVPRSANASHRWPRDVTLEFDRRCGLLLLSYTFAGQRARFPLVVRDDAAAFIAGKGTGLGEAIAAREENEATILWWAGLLLRRE